CCLYFFFFQAEDGIRDSSVTGVQTCALPISPLSPSGLVTYRRAAPQARLVSVFAMIEDLTMRVIPTLSLLLLLGALTVQVDAARSEERRVGKECRAMVGAVE